MWQRCQRCWVGGRENSSRHSSAPSAHLVAPRRSPERWSRAAAPAAASSTPLVDRPREFSLLQSVLDPGGGVAGPLPRPLPPAPARCPTAASSGDGHSQQPTPRVGARAAEARCAGELGVGGSAKNKGARLPSGTGAGARQTQELHAAPFMAWRSARLSTIEVLARSPEI